MRRRLGLACAVAVLAGFACTSRAAAETSAADTLAAHRRATHVNAPAGGYASTFDSLQFGERETATCLQCHGAGTLLLRDATTGAIHDYSVSTPRYAGSAHRDLACTQCHGDVRQYPHRFVGERRRVSCDDDCHATDERGRVVRHDEMMREQRASVHAGGLDGSDPRSPDCTDCHGGGDPHRAEPIGKGLSARARLDRCAPCHDDAPAMIASDVDPTATEGYRHSFHYASVLHGGGGAVCEDCHDTHGVRAAEDSTSRTSLAHLAATCGQENCHVGSTLAFARSGADHVPRRVAEQPVLAAIQRSLRVFGIGLLGLLALGSLLDAQWRLRHRASAVPSGDGSLVERLPLPQRVVHGALMLSFTVLMVTGAPIRFADASWAEGWTRWLGGPEVLRWTHRGAAALLLATALAHVVGSLRGLVAHRFDAPRAWSLWPTRADVAEAFRTVAHQLGRRGEAPRFGRRTWRGKLHYATVAFGVCAMSVSGLALAFPNISGGLLPPAALGLLRLLHGDEAMVALGITLVWHLYHLHLAPWPHQRFLTWWDGRVTRAYWRAEHPREAAAIEARASGCVSATRPGGLS